MRCLFQGKVFFSNAHRMLCRLSMGGMLASKFVLDLALFIGLSGHICSILAIQNIYCCAFNAKIQCKLTWQYSTVVLLMSKSNVN